MAANSSKDCQRKAHFTFIWTIENAAALVVSRCVDGPTFIAKSIEKTKWKLYMYKNIYLEELILQICREKDNGPNSIEIEYEIAILTRDGSPLGIRKSLQQFQGKRRYSLELFEDCNEVLLKRKAKFLPNDTLTVRCRMWRTGTEISKPDTCFARTRLGVDRRCFIWAIREFSSLQPKQKRTHFVNPPSHGSQQLILSLFLSKEDDVNIQIDQNSATKNLNMFCKLSLLDCGGKVVHSEETESSIRTKCKGVCFVGKFFKKDKLITDECSLLQNDVLYLKYEFQIEAEPVWSRIDSYGCLNLEELEPTANEILEMHLGGQDEPCTVSYSFKKAFEDLFGDKSLSDVSLRVGAKSFPAHMNILSVRSPVFKAMFTQEVREKTSKVVDIPDFNADTLNRLLLYIYKDTIKDLEWQSAMDLFRAADKYQLLDLRKKCSLFLKSNLSLANVLSILSLADMHGDEYLRKAAEYFISRHDKEVFKSEAWKNFKEENYRLAVEMMERIIHLIHLKYETS